MPLPQRYMHYRAANGLHAVHYNLSGDVYELERLYDEDAAVVGDMADMVDKVLEEWRFIRFMTFYEPLVKIARPPCLLCYYVSLNGLVHRVCPVRIYDKTLRCGEYIRHFESASTPEEKRIALNMIVQKLRAIRNHFQEEWVNNTYEDVVPYDKEE